MSGLKGKKNNHDILNNNEEIKDIFLDSIDKEYLSMLRSNPKYRRIKQELKKQMGKNRAIAKELMEKIERGEVADKDMDEMEFKIIALLDSIFDMVPNRDEISRFDPDDEHWIELLVRSGVLPPNALEEVREREKLYREELERNSRLKEEDKKRNRSHGDEMEI